MGEGVDALIRGLGQAVGVPTGDMPSFGKGIRGGRPRAFRRAFAQAQNPGVLHEVLPCKVPTLLVTGQREMGDMHAANAAFGRIHAPGSGAGRLWTRPWVDSYSPGPAQSDG
jgi:hypothetical protein